jgi:hypothetical protein
LVQSISVANTYFPFPKLALYSVALFRKRTTPIELPPLVGEISANFCG